MTPSSQPTSSTKKQYLFIALGILVGILVVVVVATVVGLKLKTTNNKNKKRDKKKKVTPAEENPKWTNCWINQDCDMYEGLPPCRYSTTPGPEQKKGCVYCPRPYSGKCTPYKASPAPPPPPMLNN